VAPRRKSVTYNQFLRDYRFAFHGLARSYELEVHCGVN
jgi:hypothetical protein